jgi:hypothetical protein
MSSLSSSNETVLAVEVPSKVEFNCLPLSAIPRSSFLNDCFIFCLSVSAFVVSVAVLSEIGSALPQNVAIAFEVCLLVLEVFILSIPLDQLKRLTVRELEFCGEGVRVPGGLGRGSFLNWSEIADVSLMNGSFGWFYHEGPVLQITRYDKSSVSIALRSFSATETGRLAECLRQYGAKCKVSADLEHLQSRQEFLAEQKRRLVSLVWKRRSDRTLLYFDSNPSDTDLRGISSLRVLEEGTLSVVYECFHPEYGNCILRRFCFYGLAPGEMDDLFGRLSAEVVPFQSELIPGVTEVKDSWHSANSLFVLYGHPDGVSLRSLCRKSRRISVDAALKITGKIANVLKARQEQDPRCGALDLTPDSVYCSKNGDVTIVPLTRVGSTGLTSGNRVIGDFSYRAPELLGGTSCEASQVYSLGALLYFLLKGEDPELLTQVRFRPRKSTVDLEACSLVRDCTSAEPSSRPTLDQFVARTRLNQHGDK